MEKSVGGREFRNTVRIALHFLCANALEALVLKHHSFGFAHSVTDHLWQFTW